MTEQEIQSPTVTLDGKDYLEADLDKRGNGFVKYG